MPTTRFHAALTGDNIHVPYAWTYADSTAREGASGFAATDVGKLAIQSDDNSLWILTDDDPVTWSQVGGGTVTSYPADGRLTLESGVPISTTDQSAKATLYYTPYIGDQIAIYNGSSWDRLTFTELSLSLAGYTASKPYDIFIYSNSGTPTLESLIWTDGTTRATALVRQNGILCKTGALTRRYLGTIYINASGGQTEDTLTQRFVWNYYNRVNKSMVKSDGTYNRYSTNTWRYYNNDSTLKMEAIIGYVEDNVSWIIGGSGNSDNASKSWGVGIGLNASNALSGYSAASTSANVIHLSEGYNTYPALGYNYFALIQTGAGANTQDFYLIAASLRLKV